METLAIVGLGEVGSALHRIAEGARRYRVYGYDKDGRGQLPREADYLHIAFPYTDGFVDAVAAYAEELRPRLIVVHSTVKPGTTRAIHEKTGSPTAYSPVRGKHPRLGAHLLFWPKWVAAMPRSALRLAASHLHSIGFRVRSHPGNPEDLELAKLWETVYRALMIAGWQEIHRAARKAGADIKAVAEFIAEVHKVLGDRPVYYPGHIGGHCLIPNTKILLQTHSTPLFEAILWSNEKRKHENGDPEILADVEKVRRLAEKLRPPY